MKLGGAQQKEQVGRPRTLRGAGGLCFRSHRGDPTACGHRAPGPAGGHLRSEKLSSGQETWRVPLTQVAKQFQKDAAVRQQPDGIMRTKPRTLTFHRNAELSHT